MKTNSNFKAIIIAIVVLLVVTITIVLAINSIQNKAIRLEEQIKVADSDIKVQEKRRVDLIHNLVDTVKQYDKHEANTLQSVIETRTSNSNNIENITTMINAAAEAYPELKSNENYKQLMNELSVTENIIAQHRSNYNKQVKEYNRYVKKFPNKQLLSLLGYEISNLDYLDYNAPSDAPQNLFGDEQ